MLEPYLRQSREREMGDNFEKKGSLWFICILIPLCVCVCVCGVCTVHVYGLTVSSPAVSQVSVSKVLSRPGGRARRSLIVLSSLF